MRWAAGDVVGKTVAARHLGYAPDDWRPRELWYGRCASAAALDDLRLRFAAWREREAAISATAFPSTLAQRVAAVRRLLDELARQVAGLEAEVAGSHDRGMSSNV